ncbi:hypothetical protein [Mycolicibacterium gilvum]|uniref:Uncharacterized protein n=1 Tax=Mycolicibacterium gilvum TaxID=1804 RepID=A0A378SH10_9MYCO|nr:hypothetical protein [Mycolicibacterium gilvum]STZ41665.1 Uncharacterised protein [Mycolicibacterium gilvum]
MTGDEPEGRGRRFLHAHRKDGGAGSFVDRALLVALAYTAIGVVYLGFNVPVLDRLEALFSAQFTVFADLVAIVAAVVLWPLLLVSSWVCGTAGCGVL